MGFTESDYFDKTRVDELLAFYARIGLVPPPSREAIELALDLAKQAFDQRLRSASSLVPEGADPDVKLVANSVLEGAIAERSRLDQDLLCVDRKWCY